MKAKYILRGLGLGMIITAVVMGAYTRSAVADARVSVLKEYGIGEEATLAETLVDVGDSKENEKDNGVKPSESAAVGESAVDESMAPVTAPYDEELESEIQSVLDAAEAAEQSAQDEVSGVVPGAVMGDDLGSQQGENAGGQNGTVIIEISRGDDSGTVARKLYNAGLVESAAEYDAFLMQHGYDKRLSTGTKMIDVADSWQEIAEKIASK